MPVTAEIKSYEIFQETGNILINVEYILPDSSKIVNPYHATYTNFLGKTQLEIDEWIDKQIQYQCDRYLEEYSTKANVNISLINNFLINNVGKKITKDKIKWLLTSTNRLITPYLYERNLASDEVIIKEIEIDEDGNITEVDV